MKAEKLYYSCPYLQRKFKLDYQTSKIVVDVIRKLEIDKVWNDPAKKIPDLMKPVIVEGMSLNFKSEKKNSFFVAHLDGHAGWVNHDTGEILYVSKWMQIPEEQKNEP